MKFLKEMLSDGSEVSALRVMAFIALFVGSGIGIYGVIAGKDFGGVAEICAVFISSAFGAKVVQKHIEGRDQ